MVAQRNAIQLRTNRLLSNWIYACGVIVPKKHELWAAQERRSSRRQAGVIELIRIFNWLLLYLKQNTPTNALHCITLVHPIISFVAFTRQPPPTTHCIMWQTIGKRLRNNRFAKESEIGFRKELRGTSNPLRVQRSAAAVLVVVAVALFCISMQLNQNIFLLFNLKTVQTPGKSC